MPAGRPRTVRVTMASVFAAEARAAHTAATGIVFPSPRYQRDPVAFCREILGTDPWHKQVEILEAVRDHKRVAVRSGHKIGKSRTAAMLALWFYCSYEDARVVMTSTTDRQVNAILWRELRKVLAGSGVCLECKRAKYKGPKPCPHSALIAGDLGELARTGLKATDNTFREITGFTAKEAEAVAGISGANLLYLVDEASGVPDTIYEAIEGNRAGGASICMLGNPTRNSGVFYEQFHGEARHACKAITVSSEETPNCVEGRTVVPGLAGREWVEERKREWGESSSYYKIRVKGEHAIAEEGRTFSWHAIGQAEEAWADTEAEGLLQVGVDPSGPSGTGDEAAFSTRRGLKQLDKREKLGLTPEGHVIEVLLLLREYKRADEIPLVVVDREGAVGAEVYGALAAHAEAHPSDFRLVGIRASDKAHRDAQIYDRQRDCLVAGLESWIKEGGAILTDKKLGEELHEFEWYQAANGRYKATDKKKIKANLGRSPDRFDALALSVWEPTWLKQEQRAATQPQQAPAQNTDGPALDPYAASDAFRY